MLTVEQIMDAMKKTRRKPGEEDVRRLPDRRALIKGRLSSLAQVRDSRQSMREIARLVEIAIQDGYQTGFTLPQVEKWLEDIRLGLTKPGVLENGEVILECIGLGISGSLPENKRPDLAYDMDLLRKDLIGSIYVTEGANRLARDPDGVTSATLLKLMKDTNCKLRTPDDVLSPCLERDWEVIHDELEKGAEELKVLRRRLFRRKVLKAERGGFVGEPVPAGFILPILSQAPDGKYEFGNLKKYEPHAAIVNRILQEYIKQGGSKLKTIQALAGVLFPAFEEPFRYMERYSSLRKCPKKIEGGRIMGYYITPSLVLGLATNPKLISVWHWGEIVKADNHDKIVEPELFLTAYELALSRGKAKGRAIRFDPAEWTGLLWCYDHPEPQLVFTNRASKAYLCEKDYNYGRGRICLHVAHHFLDEPLTTEVLRRLDLSSYAESVLRDLEIEASLNQWEDNERKRDLAALEQEIKKWKALLPSCVDLEKGQVDRQREEYYWTKIHEAEEQVRALKDKPSSGKAITALDIQTVREFLSGLDTNWQSYPGSLRNRLLKLLISRVELRSTQDRVINATIVWRAGLSQQVTIYLPPVHYTRDRRWTAEEYQALHNLWPSATKEALLAALPGRSWEGIRGRAKVLNLASRQRVLTKNGGGFRWKPEEEVQALYEAGVSLAEMVQKLGRGRDAIIYHASLKGWRRPPEVKYPRGQVRWEADRLKVLQESSTKPDSL